MELHILDMLQGIHTPLLDTVLVFITKLGDNGLIWILLAAALLLFKRTRKYGLVMAAALVADLVLCNLVLKNLVARVRPYDMNTAVILLVERLHDYSFPSGHTAAAFTAVAALWFAGQKSFSLIVLILAVLIAFSRLYLYVHYPTDVLGGVVIGILCGYLGWKLVEIISHKCSKGSVDSN